MHLTDASIQSDLNYISKYTFVSLFLLLLLLLYFLNLANM